jgi:hypothetical protein
MISKEQENYVILEDEHDDIQGFAGFLQSIFDQFSEKNVVIDLSKYNDATLPDLLSYLKLSNDHRATKQSFVIVNKSLSSDEIPPELLVVPTVQEAEDVIQMEEIERDLGF